MNGIQKIVCIAQNTSTEVNVLVMGVKTILHKLTMSSVREATEYVKNTFDYDLKVGECFANFEEFRNARNEGRI